VLPEQSRQFKAVFEGAQKELRTAFGMQMEELPIKEKVTIAQRRGRRCIFESLSFSRRCHFRVKFILESRLTPSFYVAAQKSDKAQTTSKSWILVSILPPEYRTPEILKPPQVPTTATESAYIGLYSFIIAIISLCGGSCNEAKLERYLKRANADQYTPVEKTDRLLIRMIKEGYLVKIKEPAGGGEDQVEYMVGPRGKVEVGSSGVSGLVKTVYADSEIDDLDQRIAKSLGLQGLARRVREEESDAGVPQTQQDDTQSRRVSVRKRRARDDEDD
jgi:hypothetical protein